MDYFYCTAPGCEDTWHCCDSGEAAVQKCGNCNQPTKNFSIYGNELKLWAPFIDRYGAFPLLPLMRAVAQGNELFNSDIEFFLNENSFGFKLNPEQLSDIQIAIYKYQSEK